MLFIATPSFSKELTVDYNQSMVQSAILLTKLGVEIHHEVRGGDCFIDHARNELVDAFLDSKATDLLFVDADVGFDARVLPRILNSPQEIVGGLVPKREPGAEVYHQNALTGRIQNGLFETLELPTAFMRIKRRVFEKLERPYFKLDSSRTERDVKSDTPSGEDIYFCRQWCSHHSLWVDPDITFSHRGSYAWRGNFYDHCVKSGLLKREAA